MYQETRDTMIYKSRMVPILTEPKTGAKDKKQKKKKQFIKTAVNKDVRRKEQGQGDLF